MGESLVGKPNGKTLSPSVKDWFALVPRQAILHQVANADCLKDRVYWALILYSLCGPDVQPACYLKNNEGRLVRDEHGQLIPLRPKHLLDILKLPSSSRMHISRAMCQLKEEFSLEVTDGLWYPVADPLRLQSVSQIVAINGNNLAYTFPRKFLSVSVPERFLTNSVAINALSEAYESIHEAFVNDNTALHKSYREQWKQAINRIAILIEEKEEDYKELDTRESLVIPKSVEEQKPTVSLSPPPAPISPPEPKAPAFDPIPTWNTFWKSYTSHEHGKDAKQGEAQQWWYTNVKNDEYANTIIEGLNRFLACGEWKDGYGIPAAIYFLKEHRYEEHPKPPPEKAKPKSRISDWSVRRLKELEAQERNGAGS